MNTPEQNNEMPAERRVCERLVAAGWLERFWIDPAGLEIVPTDKGRERLQWLRTIDREIGADVGTLFILLNITQVARESRPESN